MAQVTLLDVTLGDVRFWPIPLTKADPSSVEPRMGEDQKVDASTAMQVHRAEEVAIPQRTWRVREERFAPEATAVRVNPRAEPRSQHSPESG